MLANTCMHIHKCTYLCVFAKVHIFVYFSDLQTFDKDLSFGHYDTVTSHGGLFGSVLTYYTHGFEFNSWLGLAFLTSFIDNFTTYKQASAYIDQ